MNSGGEAAEQVVRMTLNGVEVAAKLTGKGAERLAMLIYTILKGQKRTKGKARLESMLKSGKPLTIFAVPDERLAEFCHEAKKYGILYCVLKDNKANDGMTDIMIKEDDRAKVSRIFERFKLGEFDMTEVVKEIKGDREGSKASDEKEVPERADNEEKAIDLFMEKVVPEENKSMDSPVTENPTMARKDRDPSEHSSEKRQEASASKKGPERVPVKDSPEEGRPSVKKELEEIKQSVVGTKPSPVRENTKSKEHIEVPKKKSGKERA